MGGLKKARIMATRETPIPVSANGRGMMLSWAIVAKPAAPTAAAVA